MLRRWTLGAYGIGMIFGAIKEGSNILAQLSAGQPDFLLILWTALILLAGVSFIYGALKTRPARKVSG